MTRENMINSQNNIYIELLKYILKNELNVSGENIFSLRLSVIILTYNFFAMIV